MVINTQSRLLKIQTRQEQQTLIEENPKKIDTEMNFSGLIFFMRLATSKKKGFLNL